MATQGYKRKLTAILSADVKGYSRLMGEDEVATFHTITAYRELVATLIHKHHGRVVDSPGDNMLADFVSVVDAVQCAVDIQKDIQVRPGPEGQVVRFYQILAFTGFDMPCVNHFAVEVIHDNTEQRSSVFFFRSFVG